jgi:hypothetical protein
VVVLAKAMNELPDDSYLIDAGLLIKRSDEEGQRLLTEACDAFKKARDEKRKTGSVRNYTLKRFENCQIRLRRHLFGKELKRSENVIRRSKLS